jgi:hypothetical protein
MSPETIHNSDSANLEASLVLAWNSDHKLNHESFTNVKFCLKNRVLS